ncbi:fumarate hydratase [Streptomyces malaysiensis]|uniref:fumarate hydratase n=1 Tax=Streptomyces malaysiensis TaxID=92644 RepID=UPI002B2F5C77|nr:fumarate hydratase [Streptomyces malaysiensis]
MTEFVYAEILGLRYAQLAPPTMHDERNTGTNPPVQIEIMTEGQDTYEFLFMAKGGDSEDAGPLDSVTRHTQNHYTSV